ncbi:MAG: lipopolysaccharide export system protein LptA [Psychrobacter glaciei]|jgi:lipopolysaccharide export system protein LptA
MIQKSSRFQWISFITILLVSASMQTQALPDDSEQEITISSDTAALDKLEGKLVYTGNVALQQGSLSIKADEITLVKTDSGVREFIATGKPARYQQQLNLNEDKTSAYGETLIYNLQSDELTLLTNAGLEKQGNVFTGDKIVYLINQQRVKADSVQEDRVRMVIQPKTDKEP